MTDSEDEATNPGAGVDSGVSRHLTLWLQGLLGAYLVVIAAKAITLVIAYARFDSGTTVDDLGSIASEALAVEYFEVLYLPIYVLLIVWTFSAHRASRTLWPYDRRWSARWAVGGWFIPLAWFVIPPKVLSEIHRIAMAEHRDGRVNSSWTEVPTSRILVAWWLAFAYATVAGGISRSVIEGEGVIPRGNRVATVQTAYAWSASANFVQIATAALAIVFVRQVGSRLQSDVRLGRFSQGR